MQQISFYARNDNYAIRERKRSVVDLRQATISFCERKYPNAEKVLKTQQKIFKFMYQPDKKRRAKKYHPLSINKGAIFVTRPPTNT